ncbi:MAG: hypothetical protein WAO98_07525 [Alphaproteobacteria bacterium]
MIEISTALSGRFSAQDYVPTKVNFNQPASDETAVFEVADAATTIDAAVTETKDLPTTWKPDPRVGTKFDRSIIYFGTDETFTFSDFIDLVNPLQHIPLVSSVYRSVTDEKIHPVARVAGDILYGGFLGIASAVMGGVGAASDAVTEAATGKDTTQYILASIFGDDEEIASTQLASNDPNLSTAAPTVMAAAVTPVQQQSVALLPPSAAAEPQSSVVEASQTAPTLAALASGDMAAINQLNEINKAKAYPLNRQAFGSGAINPTRAAQDQNLAAALSQNPHTTRMGNTIYTDNKIHAAQNVAPVPAPKEAMPLPNKTADNTSSIFAPTAPTADAGPRKNAIPQALINDMMMMQALKQYKGVASGPTALGSQLNITN